jgi:Holliday junction resolvasome RuvABC DNA-binding subunit
MKSLKLFTTLSSIVAIGGTSALAVLTTSCGGEKERDFGT